MSWARCVWIGLADDLRMDERLQHAVLDRRVVREDLEQRARLVAPHAHDGVDDQVDAALSRLSSMLTESTRNGMSSLTISTTVWVDVQPCSSSCGV